MIYGNGGGDSFQLVPSNGGYFTLKRHGLEQYCKNDQTYWCGDGCAAFHTFSDGNVKQVHLCCTSPPTIIRIKEDKP